MSTMLKNREFVFDCLHSQLVTASVCGRNFYEIALMDFDKFNVYAGLTSLAMEYASFGGLNSRKLSLLESFI